MPASSTQAHGFPVSISDKQQLTGIQIARGIASVMVVLHHCADTLAQPKYGGNVIAQGLIIPLGRAGVDFFFVLSGFIIYWIHAADIGQPERLKKYAAKRLSRIYPAYWVVFFIMALLFFVTPGIGHGHEKEVGTLLKGFFLVPDDRPLLLTVAWTLSHELLFYAAFALLIFKRSVGQWAMACWLMALLAFLFFERPAHPWSFLFHPRNVEFFMGIFTAMMLRRGVLQTSWGTLLLGLTVFVGASVLELNTVEFRHRPETLLYGLGSALMVHAIVCMEQAAKAPVRWRLGVFAGDASYSIYLVHFPLLVVFIKLAEKFSLASHHPLVIFFSAAILAIVAGMIFHKVVEMPLYRKAYHQWSAAS